MSNDVQEIRFGSGGTSLFAVTRGKGVPLVLMHGSGLSTHSIFNGLAEDLSTRFKVVACDIRGFGRSVSRDSADHSWDQYADDVVALLDHLSIPSAVLGGYSFGSGIALGTALRHPNRVRALILASPGYAGSEVGQTSAQTAVWLHGRMLVNSCREHGLLAGMLATQTDDDGRQWVQRAVAEHDEASFLAAHSGELQTVQPFRSLADLDDVSVPVLLIAGSDAAHDPRITHMYESHLPHATRSRSTAADPIAWVEDIRTFVP